MIRLSSHWSVLLATTVALGCSGNESSAPGGQGGGSSVNGGNHPGGASGAGGRTNSGGNAGATGGGAPNATGGGPTNAGVAGQTTIGGRSTAGAGGGVAGSSTSGGALAGGQSNSAGTTDRGGATAIAGANATGGVPVVAGSSSGGSGGAPTGSCTRPVGACTAPTVKVTDVSLGIPVTPYGREADTDPLPLAIAALPSGGSRVAWLGTDKSVHIAELDCNDQLVGTPFSIPGINLQDLHADENGGVVLLTREATGGGTHGCGTGMLCGGSSSPCRDMFMVRFDTSGEIVWETKVTNLSATLDGYQNGARFIWWYQHHGRLAFDGMNYAAYFGVAITVSNGSCVDIHQGDRMQVVSSTGMRLTGHDSFEVGCSHSWNTRIVWDPRTSHFVMVCATDNNCRIARPNPYRTIASGTCDGSLFGGDLVLSSTPGYWTAWSQGGTIRLQHFTDSGPDTSVANAGSSAHPHLVSYGASRMLLAWGSGSSMTAQVRDSDSTGAAVGSTFTIPVSDHDFQAFKAYPDGSVAYPAAGANNTSIKIARVMPCN